MENLLADIIQTEDMLGQLIQKIGIQTYDAMLPRMERGGIYKHGAYMLTAYPQDQQTLYYWKHPSKRFPQVCVKVQEDVGVIAYVIADTNMYINHISLRVDLEKEYADEAQKAMELFGRFHLQDVKDFIEKIKHFAL